MMKRLFVLYAALLLAQIPVRAFSQEPNVINPALSVYIADEQGRPMSREYLFQKGVVSRVTFVVENKSKDFIVLRNLSIKGQLPDIDNWYGSRYGSFKYLQEEDAWVYNPMAQSLSEPVFATGLLLPGKSMKINRWVIVKEEAINIILSYNRLSKEQVLKKVYFQEDNRTAIKFRKIFKDAAKMNLLLNGNVVVDLSLVIIPELDKFEPDKDNQICKVSLREPEYSLNEAELKFGHRKILDSVFWVQAGSWLFKTEKGYFLVGRKKIEKMPVIDLNSFIIIESSDAVVEAIMPLSGYADFNPQKPRLEGPGYYNPGITAFAKKDILKLLKHAEWRKDKVSVLALDPNGQGKRFYLLFGDYEDAKRRKIAEKKR